MKSEGQLLAASSTLIGSRNLQSAEMDSVADALAVSLDRSLDVPPSRALAVRAARC